MSIDEFISCMGVVLCGEERFFRQDDALWYDRRYNDCVSTAEILKRIYDQCDIDHMLEDAPTIPAIPVEWMRDKMRGYASSLKSTETAALVMVMQMWQKEQEAQDG